ncbi:MAG: DnaJ domain-containing protein [Cyanobacteria bacterium J06632_22]
MDIEQGLFKLDIADHHAVLGVPVDADAKQVRKRYLKVARKLHPDSLTSATPEQKQQASEILSKLVNPAYETLSQEKKAVEHNILLKMKGQQLQQQPALLSVSIEEAKRLSGSNNVDYDYANALKQLNAEQYESLDTLVETIGKISELNAVYMMRKGGGGAAPAPAKSRPSAAAGAAASETGTGAAAGSSATSSGDTGFIRPQRRRDMVIDSYIKRAKEFQYKGNFSRAVVELREAVKQYPDSALCHSNLAAAYIKAKQEKMASIHAKRALELDPEDSIAGDIKKRLEAKERRASKAAQQKPEKPQGGGGLFGGLFGGKKRK